MNAYFYIYLILSFSFIFPQNLTSLEANKATKATDIPITTIKPDTNKVYPIAIIGTGAAGTMAMMRAVLNNNEVLVFSGAKQERRRSRGNWVRKVDNIPGLEKYERVVIDLRNETLKNLTQNPLGNNLFLVDDSVVTLKKEEGVFKLTDGAGNTYSAEHVVLATGIMDEQPHIQGSIRPVLKYANGQTIAYCLICDGHRSFGKKTVVIGSSEEAANGALLLSEKYQLANLTLLTNGQELKITQNTLDKMKAKNIIIENTKIEEVLGDKETKKLSGFKLEGGNIIPAEIAFVLLGIRANNQLALQLGAQVDERGLVITDPSGESSVPNLFVDGDLRANSMKQIYTAWQHAVDSLQTINKRLREKKSAI